MRSGAGLTALVTGATAGIGREIARQLAADGLDLVLVARDRARLEALAAELAEHGARCEGLVADLAEPAALEAVAARVADPEHPIDVLVSNAGFGIGEAFDASAIDDERRMLDVLAWAPLRLAHAALPGMRERGRGWILTVASVAAWVAGGSYSAAKAHAVLLSRSIRARYAADGIRATALCPGFTRTEFHDRMGTAARGVPAWAWADASTVAREGLRGLRRGRAVVVSDWRFRLAMPLERMVPDRVTGRMDIDGGTGA